MRLRFVRILLPLLGLGYLLSPIDAIPDLTGPIGFIDDLLLLALIYYYRFRLVRQQTERSENSGPQAVQEPEDLPPNEVLGVPPEATADEVRSAYLSLAAQYHPDKVSHLGPELQQVAHRKMVQIQQAYEALAKAAQRR